MRLIKHLINEDRKGELMFETASCIGIIISNQDMRYINDFLNTKSVSDKIKVESSINNTLDIIEKYINESSYDWNISGVAVIKGIRTNTDIKKVSLILWIVVL